MTILSTIKAVQNKKSTTVPENVNLQVDSKPQSDGKKTMFGRLDPIVTNLLIEHACKKNVIKPNSLQDDISNKSKNEIKNTLTVGQHLDNWVNENYPDPKTAEGRTCSGYKGYIRDYIKPELGNIPQVELNPHQTHSFISWLKKRAISPKTKNHLSQTTQAHICACLSKAMNDAVKDEIILRNPVVVKISLPRQSNTPTPYNKSELDILLHAKNIPDYSLIVTGALTGSRPGELLACV